MDWIVLGSGEGAKCGEKIKGNNGTPYTYAVTCKKCREILDKKHRKMLDKKEPVTIKKPVLSRMCTVSTIQKNQRKILDYIEEGFKALGIESVE